MNPRMASIAVVGLVVLGCRRVPQTAAPTVISDPAAAFAFVRGDPATRRPL